MTVLTNTIHIDATPAQVWEALSTLDALHEYDPGIAKSSLCGAKRCGLGADRHCDIEAGGWFRERVTVWEPARALEFTLYDCTLPVRHLRHHYELSAEHGGTRVDQPRVHPRLRTPGSGSRRPRRQTQVGRRGEGLLRWPRAACGGSSRSLALRC